ncbi:MAG TPA: adenosylcobinamide-GDP ribazoletransferase, partial [Candidatus Dormibacteraeota bacterium]|nr:adenosylcobinamide-GDP ribazoletransferase [Candidatus Dormibacteraeota bacterium]
HAERDGDIFVSGSEHCEIMKKIVNELLLAFQFMTRIPISGLPHERHALARAAKFFPVVGLVIGLVAAAIQRLLAGRVQHQVLALVLIVYLVLITGALHEDGFADAADGFGGGWTKEKILTIMRDSRIGSFGAIAVALSLLSRYVLIDTTVSTRLPRFLVASSVLCRWTSLPLGFWLPYAREDKGLGGAVAGQLPLSSLLWGTGFAVVSVAAVLGFGSFLPWLITLLITAVSGLYFKQHIQGVTGDCFGATNQITEIAVYFYGALLQ